MDETIDTAVRWAMAVSLWAVAVFLVACAIGAIRIVFGKDEKGNEEENDGRS